MSARRVFTLLSLLLLGALLFTMAPSTLAAPQGPLHSQTTITARPPADDGDTPTVGGHKPIRENEEGPDFILEREEYFQSRHIAGDQPLNDEEAAGLYLEAINRAIEMRASGPARLPQAYSGDWTALGPNPIVQTSRGSVTFLAVAGRIGALTILPNGRRILGGAQGGIWVWDNTTGTWASRTDDIGSLAIGALAYAPSNPDIVYAGRGEGAMSGDSYAGNGIMKSTDGGDTWYHASGSQLLGMSVSAIVVDPNDENHLFVATLRGRGGSRRVSKPPNGKYGVYESTDGGAHFSLLKGTTDELKGATDLDMDPQNPAILYATFLNTGIFRSGDSGQTWTKIMNGLPADMNLSTSNSLFTRFAFTISHPQNQNPVLYVGFDYIDNNGDHQPSTVWKSTDEGANWTQTSNGTAPESVLDYCGGQCFYDNVLQADPNDSNVLYVLGLYDYDIGAGGIFRTDDGGMTWKNLGWDLHPDYHAIAINPSNTQEVIMGNDGGVWVSEDRGGRPSGTEPLEDTTWENLNGSVNPATAAVTHRTNLQITQFSSIATVPTIPNRFLGGTQDNGTLRRSTASQSWFDVSSGDGGQVLVDPTDANFVYGTYTGLTPYRFTDGGGLYLGGFTSNEFILTGIDQNDRAEFYIPWVMNHLNPDQLFLGSMRVYRTNNAKADKASDVLWTPISGDLTSGCSVPDNGARTCAVSALAVSAGGHGVWAGTLEGWVWYSPNATTNPNPGWKRVGEDIFPNRPVDTIAVDQSNSRVAYVGFGGFKSTTPGHPGHVYKTTTGGRKWEDVTGNLPNVPVNSLVIDPSFSNTIYAGTDVGPFVTNDGGNTWAPLGSGFPIVAIWQMDLDPTHRVLAAGTHGRGAWKLDDSANAAPALVMEKTFPDTPVGPGTDATFSITLYNNGDADATGVEIRDRVPGKTTFVSADNGGKFKKGFIVWQGLTVPMGGSLTVEATVHVSTTATKRITDKNYSASSAEGANVRGTPRTIKLSPPVAAMISPATQTDGTNPGKSVSYIVTVRNLGFQPESFQLSVSGNTFPTQIMDATCTTVIRQTGTIAPGATEDICVNVDVPNGATDSQTDTAKVKAQASSDPTVKAVAEIKTIAVTDAILLVDEDGNIPDVQSYYTNTMNAVGQPYDVWDLAVDETLPLNYLKAHGTVVMWTGNSYPAPLAPYEDELKAFLDIGGRLFLSGQDILDQSAGTSDFVHDYLHVDWDGSDAQNDKATDHVNGVGGNPVTNGIGQIPLDTSVLDNSFMDQITILSPGQSAFKDDAAKDDALTVASSPYKVMFLAFPFEEYGDQTQKTDLMGRALNWFNPPTSKPKVKQ